MFIGRQSGIMRISMLKLGQCEQRRLTGIYFLIRELWVREILVWFNQKSINALTEKFNFVNKQGQKEIHFAAPNKDNEAV